MSKVESYLKQRKMKIDLAEFDIPQPEESAGEYPQLEEFFEHNRDVKGLNQTVREGYQKTAKDLIEEFDDIEDGPYKRKLAEYMCRPRLSMETSVTCPYVVYNEDKHLVEIAVDFDAFCVRNPQKDPPKKCKRYL